MACYLCGSDKFLEILNKPAVPIWTNVDDDDRMVWENKYRCVLNQCRECGHVYQPLSDGLKEILARIYSSENAQASTPTGRGNWGRARAEIFIKKLESRKYESALELGCATDYILRRLKERGFKRLVGIDPSLKNTEERNGILFLKEFANEKLRLPSKFDFIYSNALLEHIEDINGIINFCKNNIKDSGEIFFTVPNAQSRLQDGDPGLFLHQHLQYYTPKSLIYLLRKNDLKINSIRLTSDSIDVSAGFKSDNTGDLLELFIYDTYQEKLGKVLTKIEKIMTKEKLIIHGANNSLNNILGWLGGNFTFVLVDNDETKQGRRYFNRIVRSMAEIELSAYDTILIVPVAFYEIIKSQFIKNGFPGQFESILLN